MIVIGANGRLTSSVSPVLLTLQRYASSVQELETEILRLKGQKARIEQRAGKPKKPRHVSAVSFFIKSRLKGLRYAPGLGSGLGVRPSYEEFYKICHREWHQLPKASQERYIFEAQAAMEEFRDEVTKWTESEAGQAALKTLEPIQKDLQRYTGQLSAMKRKAST